MPDFVRPRDVVLHCHYACGAAGRRAIVFANSLGTDLRIWDDVRRRLDSAIPTLAMDKRGHGLSQAGPTDIAAHATDLADLMDRFGLSGTIVCGVSVGGMIAQSLAAARPDLVVGLVLCNTGARIGDAESWDARIAAVRVDGLERMADAILDRWFAPAWRDANPVALEGWRAMLIRTPPEGYVATCAAIRDADLTDPTSGLAVPTLCVAGSDDGATPPDLVRDLSRLIDGAEYRCLDGVGHLPCIEAPDKLAVMLADFYATLS